MKAAAPKHMTGFRSVPSRPAARSAARFIPLKYFRPAAYREIIDGVHGEDVGDSLAERPRLYPFGVHGCTVQ